MSMLTEPHNSRERFLQQIALPPVSPELGAVLRGHRTDAPCSGAVADALRGPLARMRISLGEAPFLADGHLRNPNGLEASPPVSDFVVLVNTGGFNQPGLECARVWSESVRNTWGHNASFLVSTDASGTASEKLEQMVGPGGVPGLLLGETGSGLKSSLREALLRALMSDRGSTSLSSEENVARFNAAFALLAPGMVGSMNLGLLVASIAGRRCVAVVDDDALPFASLDEGQVPVDVLGVLTRALCGPGFEFESLAGTGWEDTGSDVTLRADNSELTTVSSAHFQTLGDEDYRATAGEDWLSYGADEDIVDQIFEGLIPFEPHRKVLGRAYKRSRARSFGTAAGLLLDPEFTPFMYATPFRVMDFLMGDFVVAATRTPGGIVPTALTHRRAKHTGSGRGRLSGYVGTEFFAWTFYHYVADAILGNPREKSEPAQIWLVRIGRALLSRGFSYGECSRAILLRQARLEEGLRQTTASAVRAYLEREYAILPDENSLHQMATRELQKVAVQTQVWGEILNLWEHPNVEIGLMQEEMRGRLL